MGNGSCKGTATPTALKGYRREVTSIHILQTNKEVQILNEEPVNKKGVTPQSQETSDVQSANQKSSNINDSDDHQTTENSVNENSSNINDNNDNQSTESKANQQEQRSEKDEGFKLKNDKDFIRAIYGYSTTKWPITSYVKLGGYNINAGHGGGTAVILNSRQYGQTSDKGNSQMMLIQSGFDCNHMQVKSIGIINCGYHQAENRHLTDENGEYVPCVSFGTNHQMLISNEERWGNLRNGVFFEIPEGQTEVESPLNVNSGSVDYGCGLSLLLASGIDGKAPISTLYMLKTGISGNEFTKLVLSGEDSFKFEATEEGILKLSGPTGSRFTLMYNRNEFVGDTEHAYVKQIQAVDGSDKTLMSEIKSVHAAFVILCSNSNGTEDCTVSSIYYVTVSNGRVLSSTEVCGAQGPTYAKSDLWTFEVEAEKLYARGPQGPCRYGVISNCKSSRAELMNSICQDQCLATGEETKTTGLVDISLDGITGQLNKPSSICIMMNVKVIQRIPEGDLKKESAGCFTFSYKWKKEETEVGYHIIRVYGVRKHTRTGEDVFIELTGSPYQMTRQKPGVLYALNLGGPAYQDLNDIVYASEHKLFANFDRNIVDGYICISKGGIKKHAKLPASMLRSHDGFLYGNTRAPFSYDEHNMMFQIKVPGLPNGKFRLRLHLIKDIKYLKINGENVASIIQKELDQIKRPGDLVAPSCYCVDIEVTITNNTLVLYSRSENVYKHADHICAFAVLDQSYKDNTQSEAQIKQMGIEKQTLSDNIAPINNSPTRKEMTIAGWSVNLIQNASGETKDMKYWNTSGDFKVSEATGYGTETCFATSYMWCSKYQEINLLDHYTEEYLDTAPDIQVSEMIREGHCDGGFYKMTVSLLTSEGEVIVEHDSGEIDTKNNYQWQEVKHTFSDYGKGVRIFGFSSQGKDNKYWKGYFGPYMCAAQVRVRSEIVPAEGDEFADIDLVDSQSGQKGYLDKLVSSVLAENKEISEAFAGDGGVMVDEKFEKQTEIVAPNKPGKFHRPRKVIKKREIRVFVSSTFRDFKNEREEIIKKAFREVNRICQERGVFFTYVDLRWGITSEQTNDGKTIAICLQEIEKCRPYFICMMGERFGWCQQQDKKDKVLDFTFDYAIENLPNLKWLPQHRYDASVTQLEIFHGVLNNKDLQKDKVFFYIRDPPSEKDYPANEYKRLVAESDWHHQQQESLKNAVKACPGLNIKQYKTAEQVSDMIKNDLENIIEIEFPKGTELTKLEQVREAHHAFASARCRVYIGRQDYFTEIHQIREKNISTPFVLLGESGSGKSALVANWTKQIEDKEPDIFLFIHFIGSSAESANYIKMIRRLLEEMKSFYKFDMDIPSSDSVLIHEMYKWLRMAGSLTKVVIVFDALNQLDDGTGEPGPEHDLEWIPKEIPHNVFILVSTLPGRAMDACSSKGWPTMKVEPLQDSQKMEIITNYLEGIYGKTLTTEQKEMIVKVKQTSNPLYLKSLLDEVRMYGSFRTLTDKILEYLSAESPQDLFAKILERLEEDFESGASSRPNIVRDFTTAIWCSNRGMSESELIEYLQVTSAMWSPFYISLFENLVNRNGILNFFHDHLRQAVEKKYLPTEELKKTYYKKLGDFFQEKDINNRTVEELPFLLTQAGELEKLQSTITNLHVFYLLSKTEDGTFELIKAWKTLGGFSLSEKAYMSELSKVSNEVILENAEYYTKLYSRLGKFFMTLGLMNAAKDVYKTLIKQLEVNYGDSHGTIVYNCFKQEWKYRCKHPDVIQALHDLGTVYNQLGDLEQAIITDNDAINRQNRVDTPSEMIQLCEGLLGLSAVYLEKDDMMEAKVLMTRALELATFVLGSNHHYVAAILTKLGQVSYRQGRVDEALAYNLQDLKMTRSEVGTNHPRTAIVLNEIGLVYDDKNNKMAKDIYEAALAIILDTYGNEYLGTGTIRYNLGVYFFGAKLYLKAKYQLTESYRIHQMFLGDDHTETKSVKKALDTVSEMT